MVGNTTKKNVKTQILTISVDTNSIRHQQLMDHRANAFPNHRHVL